MRGAVGEEGGLQGLAVGRRAVKRLAANDPSGRHICSRAYVSGQGWQKPVCDGTIAGTSGRNRPIKALNIAVHGVGGSAANAFRHTAEPVDGRGKWQPNWTAVTGDGLTSPSAARNGTRRTCWASR
ncbi:hypothetical protein [Streptomyces sp. enrichment culture]|uniref:hypothetical protein n=1 Tax=Streptomyces sp. enrichment culture TaxID=1795815 RepID=UPI003F543E92